MENVLKPAVRLSLCIGLLLFCFSQPALSEEGRLSDMISPVSHPTTFEDPRMNTEVRPIFMHHEIDSDFITQGGDVQLYALQLRYAISDDLAIIATKDGYVDFNPDAALVDEEGWANVSGGVKYAFFRNAEEGVIATGGLRYEAPVGNRDVFFGEGDGHLNPFVSAAVAIGDISVMSGSGLRLAVDGEDSSFWDLDLHISYKLGNFYPLIEVGMIHVVDSGRRLPVADEGEDLFSFGSINSEGKSLVTGGIGARYRVSDDIDLGVVYQIPLTSGAGSNILDWRLTTDLIYSFDI